MTNAIIFDEGTTTVLVNGLFIEAFSIDEAVDYLKISPRHPLEETYIEDEETSKTIQWATTQEYIDKLEAVMRGEGDE